MSTPGSYFAQVYKTDHKRDLNNLVGFNPDKPSLTFSDSDLGAVSLLVFGMSTAPAACIFSGSSVSFVPDWADCVAQLDCLPYGFLTLNSNHLCIRVAEMRVCSL